jgi:hypothetical protein
MDFFIKYGVFFLQTITCVIAIIWFFAKLDKRIDMINQKMDLKFDILGKDIKEIKDNHLAHLSEDIKVIDRRLTEHIVNDRK